MMDTIGFLGCGNMGGAIARAVCKAVDPKKVFLANRTAAKAQALAKELGCKTATNAEVAGDCDLIFLAVKPQMMEALLQPLKFTFDERPSRFVLCSMAAGLSIARIQELAGENGGQIDRPVQTLVLSILELVLPELRASGTVVRTSFPEYANDILTYLQTHIHEKVTMETLSQTFHLSASHISRVFSNAYHTSPINYLIYCRMRTARTYLLRSHMSHQRSRNG